MQAPQFDPRMVELYWQQQAALQQQQQPLGAAMPIPQHPIGPSDPAFAGAAPAAHPDTTMMPLHSPLAHPHLLPFAPTVLPSPSSSPSAAPFHSEVLSSPLDADIWLLIMHRLYHARSSWSRGIGASIFSALQQELRLSSSAASAASSRLTAHNWLGQPRPLSFDELMTRCDTFPKDYSTQLMREMIATSAGGSGAGDSSVDHSATTAGTTTLPTPHGSPMKPRRDPSSLFGSHGHSLLTSTSSSSSSLPSLWSSGQSSLLPSLRRSRTDTSVGGVNLLCALRHRESGTSSSRLCSSRIGVGATSSARACDLFSRRMRHLKVVTGHRDAIYCVTFDRTSRRIFTGSDDATVKVWDARSGALVATCRGHSGVLTEISVSPDNLLVASASNDSRIRIWDTNGLPLAVLIGHTADVMRVIFNPDFTAGNRFLVSASLDGTARIWDCNDLTAKSDSITCKPKPWSKGVRYIPYDLEGLADGGEVDSIPQVIVAPEFMCLAFHPSGSEFVAGHNDHRARVYDMKRRSVLAVLSGHRGEVESVAYSHDGTRILTISSDGEAIVWARVEFSQIEEAANLVGFTLPTTPPAVAGSVWSHQTSAPLHQAAFYRGLQRAVQSAAASSSQPTPTAAAAAAEPVETEISHAAAGMPTHRYIIVARLSVTPPSSSSSSSAAPSASSTGADTGASSVSVVSGLWSLHDDYIVGASSAFGVLVWRIPPLGQGGRLEMVDPFLARQAEEAALAAAASRKNGGRVTTGRAKRTAEEVATPALKPLTFLSCFKRVTLPPVLSFSVHTGNVAVLQRHPTLADIILSAGADGRVVLYSIRQRRVLKVFHHLYQGSESPFVDGAFSTTSDLLVLTNEIGQLYLYGSGVEVGRYLVPPEQQFFVRDYLGLQRDAFDQVIDQDSQRPPHLAPGATTLCDLNGVVYATALPEATPLAITPVPVPRITPNQARVRVRLYDARVEPRARFFAHTRTGLMGHEEVDTNNVEDTIEVDTDCWRTSTRAPLDTHTASDLLPTSSVQLVDHIRTQQAAEVSYLRWMYQVRVAYQQQRQLIRIAANAADSAQDANAGAIMPPTWHPLLSLPLPIHTPLLRSADSDDEADDEADEETRLYRHAFFDANGMVRRQRPGGPRNRPHTTAAAAVAPHAAASSSRARAPRSAPSTAAASNIHTLGGTRHTAIQLSNDDDNYYDDDYQPDVPASRAARPAAAEGTTRERAQRRALQRFEELKADEEEEEKKEDVASSREHSEYSEAEDEEEEAPTNRRRRRQGDGSSAGSGSDSEVGSSEASLSESTVDSNSDSDGSYRRGRRSSDRRRQKRARSASRSRHGGGGSGSGHDTRPPRKRRNVPYATDQPDEDWSEGPEDEESLVRDAFSRDKRAKKRAAAAASAAAANAPQRAARKRASYAEIDEDSTFDETVEEAAAAASALAASKVVDADSSLDSRLFQGGNWLQRPLAQLYNSSYVPQLGDRVMYVRAGHEAQLGALLARMPGLPASLPKVRAIERCVVARIEYMWSEDARTPALLRSPNRLFLLPRTQQGHIDPLSVAAPPPPVFARITLVPVEDAHLIRNDRPPPDANAAHHSAAAAAATEVKAEPEEALESHADASAYDFSSLLAPSRLFEFGSFDEKRDVLRLRVAHPPAAAAADETISAVRPKRSLRSATTTTTATTEASDATGHEVVAASSSASSSNTIRIVRQSTRTAINHSRADASNTPAADPSSVLMNAYRLHSAAGAVSSTKPTGTRIILRGARAAPGAAGDAAKITWSATPPAAAAANESSSSSSRLRLSQRQRVPKRVDAYTAHLESAQKDEDEDSERDSEEASNSVHFPPSAFNIDLFEPQGADFLILLSRLTHATRLHPSPWRVGEPFRMKYADEPDWSYGTVCANDMPDDAEMSSHHRTVATRHQKAAATMPSPWECLKVAWHTEAEIQRVLAAEATDRASSLVADPLASLEPEERMAQRRMDLLARWSQMPDESEDVSPWEIDPIRRGVIDVADIDKWIATDSQACKNELDFAAAASSAASSAAAAASSSESSSVPSLVRVLDPLCMLDTNESLSDRLIASLLRVLDGVLASSLFEPFCAPVSRTAYREYAHVVPYAMDVSTIRRRVALRYYRTVSAVAHDVGAIYRAARLYNQAGSDIVRTAKQLEAKLLRGIRRAVAAAAEEAAATTSDSADVPTFTDASHPDREQLAVYVDPDQRIAWDEVDEEEEDDEEDDEEEGEGAKDEEEPASSSSRSARRLAASSSASRESEPMPTAVEERKESTAQAVACDDLMPMDIDEADHSHDAAHIKADEPIVGQHLATIKQEE